MPHLTTSQSVINRHVKHGHSIRSKVGIDEQSLEEWINKRLAGNPIKNLGA
jgi:hypothetical protein